MQFLRTIVALALMNVMASASYAEPLDGYHCSIAAVKNCSFIYSDRFFTAYDQTQRFWGYKTTQNIDGQVYEMSLGQGYQNQRPTLTLIYSKIIGAPTYPGVHTSGWLFEDLNVAWHSMDKISFYVDCRYGTRFQELPEPSRKPLHCEAN